MTSLQVLWYNSTVGNQRKPGCAPENARFVVCIRCLSTQTPKKKIILGREDHLKSHRRLWGQRLQYGCKPSWQEQPIIFHIGSRDACFFSVCILS